jgi:hypothetical protein
VLGITVLEFRIVSSTGTVESGVGAAKGVLEGQPYYKTYQNRFAGPVLVAAISRSTGQSFEHSYKAATALLLVSANLLGLFLFGRYTGRLEAGLMFTVAYAFLTTNLQAPMWLPIWDFVELNVMLVFAWAAFADAGAASLFALFLFAIFNRETALFIPVWMLVRNIIGRSTGMTQNRNPFSKWILPVLMIAAGVAWTHFSRNHFFVKSHLSVPAAVNLVEDQFWMLPHTLEVVAGAAKVHILAALVMTLWTVAVIVGLYRSGALYRAISIIVAGMLASILMFGLLSESRLWMSVIPFLLWATMTRFMSRETDQTGTRPEAEAHANP